MSPINIPNSPDTGAMDVDTNGNLFLAGGGSPFWCVRSSNAQIGNQTPTFDRVTQVNMGGDLIQGGVNGDWTLWADVYLRWIVPGQLQTITFTWWPVCYRPVLATGPT